MSSNHKVNIVAEIGTAHGGNIAKAKELIDTAAATGCDMVKFQWVYADEILHPLAGNVLLPSGNIPLYDTLKELEQSVDFYKELSDYASSCGLAFGCSPFGIKSLDELWSIKPACIKIASPELNHYPLLKELVKLENKENNKVPVVLSSGVSTLSDIEKALDILTGLPILLLHCITCYPAPEEEYNIKLLHTLSSVLGVQTGISDHSLDPVLIPLLSVAFGGIMIEKHITLNNADDGLDDKVALNPVDFKKMVDTVRLFESAGKEEIIRFLVKNYGENRIEKCIGSGIKKLSVSEEKNYGRTNRSIHFMRDMKAGEIISVCDISVLRTEKVLTPGISPYFIDEVQGRHLVRDAKNGEGLVWNHLIS